MIIDPNITKLNITEDIINHFFSKTKIAQLNITKVELVRTNKISHLLRVTLEPNQTKRLHSTIEININKLRDYKLNILLHNV
jgi:hypothetical protein